ncbi:MAG: VOC family protein [Candidatus Polarisedimenticolia bacterium]
MPVKPVPEGYHTVTPYLIVHQGTEALAWYTKALDAKELMRFEVAGGKIGHAEFKLGDSIVMMADEAPEMGHRSPKSLGGAGVSLAIYVPDVDKAYARAIAAGGKEIKPLANQFYGDRSGTFQDPFGHVWTIATHVEDVTPDEMKRRMKAMK